MEGGPRDKEHRGGRGEEDRGGLGPGGEFREVNCRLNMGAHVRMEIRTYVYLDMDRADRGLPAASPPRGPKQT